MRVVVLSHVYRDPLHRRKLRELAGLGWSVTAVVPNGPAETDGQLRIAAVSASGRPVRADRRRWSGRALRKLLRDIRPDLLHLEEEPGTPAAATAVREARRLGIPVVLFSWQSRHQNRSFLARRRFKRAVRDATAVIGGNRLAQGILSDGSGRPSLSLPQFGVVPPSAVERPTAELLALACVGRLVPERGVDRLLRVCGQLMGPWSLAIGGTGPEQESLEALAARLGLAARIRWLGPQTRSHVAELWRVTDCLVIPSRTTETWLEAWSPVLVDAMAHGVTPVVTGEGALPEIVGDAGLVVRDDDEMLVALQELVTQLARRRALGDAARQRVLERYSDAALARELDRFWREVIGGR